MITHILQNASEIGLKALALLGRSPETIEDYRIQKLSYGTSHASPYTGNALVSKRNGLRDHLPVARTLTNIHDENLRMG